MAGYGGPRPVDSSLVFGYDTGYGITEKGVQVRHYKGEPVTNSQNSDRAAMNPTGTASWGCYDGVDTPYHTWGRRQSKQDVTVSGPFGGKVTAMYYSNPTGGFHGPTDWSSIPNSMLQTGNKVTFQAWVKAATDASIGQTVTPYIYYSLSGGGAHASSTSYTLTGDWQLVHHTVTVGTAASGTGIVYLFTSQTSGRCDVYITYTGFHNKDHPVHWTTGTRSSTEGLLDMSSNNTSINLNNVSFDSTGLPTFDGTNDYIEVSYSSNLDTPGGATFEIIIYPMSAGEILSRGISDSGTNPDNPRIYTSGTGNVYFDWSSYGADRYIYSSTNLTMNSWNHLVCTATPGGNLKIYINGTSAGSGQTLPVPLPNTPNPLIIGGVNWVPRYVQAKIPVVKVYNKILSADEISRNYNTYKNRFEL